MTRAKSSSYNSIKTKALIYYINDYNKQITALLNDETATARTNRATLKSVAAGLETVVKQLKANR